MGFNSGFKGLKLQTHCHYTSSDSTSTDVTGNYKNKYSLIQHNSFEVAGMHCVAVYSTTGMWKKTRPLSSHFSVLHCSVLGALRYKIEVRGFDFRWSHWLNPSGYVMALVQTQPLEEMSTRILP